MLFRAHICGILFILTFYSFGKISSSPQREIKQNDNVSGATLHLATNQTNQTGSTAKTITRLTESYLPATMQALAHYIELLQYEPLFSTTIEPEFTVSTTPLTFPNFPSSSTQPSVQQQPVTWWSPPSTTTQKPTTWWNAPSTTTTKPTTWWSTTTKPSYAWWSTKPTTTSSWYTTTSQKPWWDQPLTESTTTKRPIHLSDDESFAHSTESTVFPTPTTTPWTTRKPSVSTTTPSWWHRETTPFHKPGIYMPGNFAPDHSSNDNAPPSSSSHLPAKPHKPQFGDLSFLSISNFPHFEYFVKPNSKAFVKKAEYEYLHQYPAELLQDIESEPYQLQKLSDQEIVNDFRRVYDDFFTRVRVFAPVTGKKRVPPTRPYVLFLILYDLYKREAKRLSLQDFAGYSESMMARLHETSKYSAERQLYTLMDELLAQKSIHATDVLMRMNEIMTDLSNPSSVTAKALHVLQPLKFEL